MMNPFRNLVLLTLFTLNFGQECTSDSPWTYECRNEVCLKIDASTSKNEQMQLSTCKLTCGPHAALFPKPSVETILSKSTLPFLPSMMKNPSLSCTQKPCDIASLNWYVANAFNILRKDMEDVYQKLKKPDGEMRCQSSALGRRISTNLIIASDDTTLTLETDESYRLNVSTDSHADIEVQITAKTFFGARHAFETLSQLTEYDEINNSMQVLTSALILDKPAYPYRGVLLDTSRNYFSIESIIRLVNALSYTKMNTLHWHITDTHSFPIEIKSVPNMQKYGAYSHKKVYTHKDVRTIVEHGKLRGVRILAEFDQPAHCGEGWQWGPKTGLGDLAVCVNKQPWQKYCVEPPCGQLNPANQNIYPVLNKIYTEYFKLFNPDVFHAGGDEVHLGCWNTTEEIRVYVQKTYGDLSEKSFMKLWKDFLDKSSAEIVKANNNKDLPLIVWTSMMTSQKYLTDYLDKDKHIIQLWTTSKSEDMANVVRKGFRTIFSTYDTLYLDCGYGNWLTEGNNWCAPYKDWKLLYDNSPRQFLNKNFNITIDDKVKKSILGQEAAMWSEQVDDQAGDSKIWPRAAALAERLWTDPDHNWEQASTRMIHHRERMVDRGIPADALQPLWCDQNEKNCYYDPSINGHYADFSSRR